MSGKYNEDLFKKSYAFVNEYRNEEVKELKDKLQKIQKIKGKEKIEPILKAELLSLQSALKRDEMQQQKAEIKSQLRKENKERVLENKAPKYHKKSEINTIVLEKKLEVMDKKGKAEGYINRKRREAEGKKAGMIKSIQAKKIKKLNSLKDIN